MDRSIKQIRVGRRFRKDLGDVHSLADSLDQIGLLHPVVITPQGQLIAGARRLEAAKLLGWKTIPVSVVDLENIVDGELAENVHRKDFLPSELWEIAKKVRAIVRTPVGRPGKMVENCHHSQGKTRDKTAACFGISGRHLDKIGAICEGEFPDLIEEIDAVPRSVNRCFQKMKTLRQQQAARGKSSRPTWTITADQTMVPCQLLLADPPYGITKEPWEPENLEQFTRGWSHRCSKCGADFLAIFWSQQRLFEGREWFDESLRGYTFQQLLVWHANNHCGPKSRMWFKQTWVPILLYRRVGSSRQIISHEKTWDGELHNLDCHASPVPQINYNGHDLKQHPAQKPVSVMRWLIHALSERGEKVVSPFCGVAPCGIAALQLGRQFHGIEINRKYRQIAEARLATYGVPEKK